MAREDDNDEILNNIDGKAAIANPFHGFQPAMFGSTNLALTREHVIERTHYMIAARTVTLRLDKVESVAIITSGNPLMLVLGLPLLFVCGIGIIFLVLYLVFKYRFLVVHGAATVLVIGVKGDVRRYEDFSQDILDEISRRGRGQSGGGGGSSGGGESSSTSNPAPTRSQPQPGTRSERVAPATEGKKTISVTCPECDAEYQVAATSAGKKFRCQKCQAVMEVGNG